MTCDMPLVYNSDIWASTVSPDQLGIHEYIETLNYPGAKLLHVGIGNSALFLQFGEGLCQVDGITIMDSEVKVAQEIAKKSSTPYVIYQFNKYDISQYSVLAGRYHFIVDNNLKQHACCDQHWHEYFNLMLDMLTPRGQLLTHNLGFASHSNLVDKLTIEELVELLNKRTDHKWKLSVIQKLANERGYSPVVIERSFA